MAGKGGFPAFCGAQKPATRLFFFFFSPLFSSLTDSDGVFPTDAPPGSHGHPSGSGRRGWKHILGICCSRFGSTGKKNQGKGAANLGPPKRRQRLSCGRPYPLLRYFPLLIKVEVPKRGRFCCSNKIGVANMWNKLAVQLLFLGKVHRVPLVTAESCPGIPVPRGRSQVSALRQDLYPAICVINPP